MVAKMPAATRSASVWPQVLVGGLVVLSLGLPLVLYRHFVGRAPSLAAAEARSRLNDPGYILVDLRTPAPADAPAPASVAWSAAAALAAASPADLPPALRSRTLLLLSAGGVESAQAAQHLAALGLPAYSIQGGVQSWIASAPAEIGPGYRALPAAEQWALVGGVYPIKFLYMALALVGVGLVWGQATPSLTALRWSLITFLMGEFFCWVNILFFVEESITLEYLHSWGMVVCVALLAFAAAEAADHGLVHYSDPRARCAFTSLCRTCAKHSPGACRLRRLVQWGLPALGVLALMPLTAEPSTLAYNTRIFGVWRTLTHPVIIQLYEIRVAPALAVALIGLGWVVMQWRGQTAGGLLASKVLLAAGLGHLGFAFMRLAFFSFYGEHLAWFIFWEETTELWLVGMVLVVLVIFQPTLTKRLADAQA